MTDYMNTIGQKIISTLNLCMYLTLVTPDFAVCNRYIVLCVTLNLWVKAKDECKQRKHVIVFYRELQ